ncbi:HAD-IA family hydrolase [Candidatus Pelagibacter ubique]|jgi:putative hydrolase of the HAD superfamily|nr:HAD-IA family hydrolase [Candidatus Pelagibacter ubique]
MGFHKINLSKSVIVLDLDDTLYNELDYQISGFKEVIKCLKDNYKIKTNYQFIHKCIRQKKNILEELCKKYGLKKSIIKSLLWVYRLHKPRIYMKKNVKKSLNRLERMSSGVAILTDGRSISQRLKLQALGICHLPMYISEDYIDKKPSIKRFKLIMKDMPAKKYVYIGDNPLKDFLAPNKLKWLTIGIKGSKRNIYSQKIKKINKEYLPDFWVKDFLEILDILKN